MKPLRIHAPGDGAALLLAEKLSRYRASAAADGDGAWVVSVPLDSASRETVPGSLSATRDWLDECGLSAAAVELDGHTHVIRSGRR